MLNLAVQLLLFYLMLLIGLSLTTADLARIVRYPRLIISTTLVQLMALPLIAAMLIFLFEPARVIAIGMLLVSVCPAGALSNFYSLIARADAALSLTLTGVSSLVSVFLLPLLVLVFYPYVVADNANMASAAKGIALKQLLMLGLMLLLPVVLGMGLRRKFSQRLQALLPAMEKMGFIALIILLAAIFYQHYDRIGDQLQTLSLLALMFTLAAIAVGGCLSRVLATEKNQTGTLLLEFPVRNMAVAATLALSIFASAEYLLFAALFLAVQTPLLLVLVWWQRRYSINSDASESLTAVH